MTSNRLQFLVTARAGLPGTINNWSLVYPRVMIDRVRMTIYSPLPYVSRFELYNKKRVVPLDFNPLHQNRD